MTRQLVYVGTYSEPILFGTGQVLDGKGKGIYSFAFDAAAGALAVVGVTEGVRNSSYLAFDPARRFLFCVNEFKEFEGKASGAVSAFRIDRETGALPAIWSSTRPGVSSSWRISPVVAFRCSLSAPTGCWVRPPASFSTRAPASIRAGSPGRTRMPSPSTARTGTSSCLTSASTRS
jgi:hypothetical protein